MVGSPSVDVDAVVIGAGPNGLVAANVLADHGWSVLVCEAEDVAGGAVRSAELVEPGFTNDVFSAFYPLAVASPAMTALRLEQHGVVWRRSPYALAHPAPDGSCPVVAGDLADTVEMLDRLHPGDGQAFRRLFEQWQRVEKGLLGSMFGPFPPVKAGLRTALALRRDLLRFTRFALLPVRRMGEEEFGGEAARRLFAGNALHADFSPEATLSGFFGWLLCSLAQSAGFPVPEGGAARLAEALVRRLETEGGQVRLSSPVERVLVRRGRAVGVRLADGTEVAAQAVVADTDAVALYRGLVGEEHLPHRLLHDLDRFQWDLATVKVDWTLDGPIPWEAEAAGRSGVVHVADSVDALTLGTAQLACGRIPERPFLLLGQYSVIDPTRQPAGKETVWAYTHVPQHVKGDAGGSLTGSWDEGEAEAFADRMEAEVERLAPGFRRLVRGRHILTPKGLSARDRNLHGGAINGGTAQLHQQLVFRPVPGLGRPETPIRGLYLGSSSAHPGGGLHGACGANAARAALLHRRLGR